LRVAYVLYALCQAAGLSAGLIGGLGCRVADRVLPPLGSDPEALDVQELLSGMRRSGCQTCVVELPTAAIQQGCLDSTDLFALVSVDWSPRDGQKATTRDGPNDSSSRCTGAPSSHGWDPVESGGSRPWRIARCASEAGEEAEEINLYFQGAFRSALASGLLRGAFQRLGPGSSRVEVRTPAGPLSLRIPFPGRANARAVMAAAAVALALRLPGRDIEHAVARLEPIPGHLEPVITRRPFRVLVDGCRSVAEFEQTLRAVREFTPARVLLLFGCGAGHDRSARARIGELAARGADLAVLTSDNPGWEAPEVIAAQVASGYIRIRGLAPRFIPDRGEAIRRLLGEASAGDCVLLAGKGHRPLEQVAGCVLPFDDRAHARAALHAVDSFRGGAEVSA
jgi:UDP-N-acetylmuramoyl-L-alanyl-D-glutamate--2,6-diaminopimelate ligase